MPKHGKLLLYGLVWFGTYFRIPALFANHYHADEALFSSWARLIAVWRDPLLASQLVDKPPLLFYLQAVFYPLMGAVEWASRLPNLIASLLLVPIVAILSWRIYREPAVSLLAALFITISPVAIQVSATAYTDPLLITLLALALLFSAGEEPKPILCGFFFGLAVATKYQAWIYLPLLVGITWLANWNLRFWRRWLFGVLPILLAVAIWEFARSGAPVIWTNQLGNFGGLRLIYSWELVPRFSAWFGLWQVSIGSPLLLGFFILGVILLLLNSITNHTRAGSFDLLLIIYGLAYLMLHWLLAIPVWDRYLVPLIPLLAILFARSIVSFWHLLRDRPNGRSSLKLTHIWLRLAPLLTLAIIVLIQIPLASSARSGQQPFGGQPTADQGAWQVAEYLAAEPYGTVLYDHWYSWHWQYHLFDKGVYVSWFPHPTALTDDLAAFGDTAGARYIVLPDNDTALPVLRSIANAGFKLQEELQDRHAVRNDPLSLASLKKSLIDEFSATPIISHKFAAFSGPAATNSAVPQQNGLQ